MVPYNSLTHSSILDKKTAIQTARSTSTLEWKRWDVCYDCVVLYI